ncbi:MAG: hypothetical protein QG612_29 [Pseudomonadota bacterium]|nr:hypothetical protein [Pseudomonadota bacterium]
MSQASTPLGHLIRFVVRCAFVAAGAVFFLSLLLAGVLAALGLTLWSLLRGRRPVLADLWQVQRTMRARARARSFGDWPSRRGTASPAAPEDIVEVQAREVMPAARRMTQG